MDRASTLQRHAFDAAVVALVVVAQVEIWVTPVPGPRGVVVPLVLLSQLPLLLRRRFPFAAPVSAVVTFGALSFVHAETVSSLDTNTFTLLLAFWAIGAQDDRRLAAAGAAIGFASIAVLVKQDARIEPGDAVGVVITGAGLALAAFALQRRARRAVELEERAVRFEGERAERERVAVAEERRRIARDLHDVVAHSVGVMTVQAGAARLQLVDEPGRALGPLLVIEETGRQALVELRLLLGMLRRDDGDVMRTPQPGLGDLEELVAQVRRAGLPVELSVQGTPAALSPGVDLTAYRIVQEGLTNTRKHAGPAHASVAVRFATDALELEIVDDGRIAPNGGTGHGLVGMRERTALYGGELEAGARPQGGFAVRARLPLNPDPYRQSTSRTDDADTESVARRSHPIVRDGFVFDILVVAVAAITELEIWFGSVPGPKLILAPAVLLYTLPLLARRRFPFAAPALAFAVQAVITFAGDAVGGETTGLAALLLTFWSVGAHNERRHAVAATAIGFASLAVIVQWDVRLGYTHLLNGMALGAGLALAAFALQRRARRAVELEERAVRFEGERAERERVAVAEERRRIARDLHDVVAHSVGVMTVQAGAARLQLVDEPGRALGPLLVIEETGRQALVELRLLLGMLRRDDSDVMRTPQPGLGDLEDLVAQVRRAGLPVELSVQGTPAALSPGVDLTAYRIVQEGLTNARKHAGPAHASVAVRFATDALELEIIDDGRIAPNGGTGHGLVGMRERTALYGGELEAGARPQGGFAVRARLPLNQGER